MEEFVRANDLKAELKRIGLAGVDLYRSNPEGLFMLGYTIGLFPYYFGEYGQWETISRQMLFQAGHLMPANPIYQMVQLGLQKDWPQSEEYKKTCQRAAPIVKEKYQGKGLLNAYFREVLYRID